MAYGRGPVIAAKVARDDKLLNYRKDWVDEILGVVVSCQKYVKLNQTN